MTIIEQLKERVRVALKANHFRGADEMCADTNDAIPTALTAIDTFFEDYEEVEVEERRDSTDHWLRMPDSYYYGDQHGTPQTAHCAILKQRPPQQTVTVTRETLAVLAEHYEDTPAKDEACEAALAEARDKL